MALRFYLAKLKNPVSKVLVLSGAMHCPIGFGWFMSRRAVQCTCIVMEGYKIKGSNAGSFRTSARIGNGHFGIFFEGGENDVAGRPGDQSVAADTFDKGL